MVILIIPFMRILTLDYVACVSNNSYTKEQVGTDVYFIIFWIHYISLPITSKLKVLDIRD